MSKQIIWPKVIAAGVSIGACLWMVAPSAMTGDMLASFLSGQEAEDSAEASRELDYSYFKEAEIIRAFHQRDFDFLNKNERTVLLYTNALSTSLPQAALFSGETTLQRMLDDTVPAMAARKMALSANSHNQTLALGAKIAVNAYDQMQKVNQPGYFDNKTFGDFTADMTKMVLPGDVVPLEQIQGAGSTDARRLIALYQQSPADFEKIYATMVEFASSEGR